jgi:hypothetical protein
MKKALLIGAAILMALYGAGWGALYLANPAYLTCAEFKLGAIPAIDAYCALTIWCADHPEASDRACASADFPLSPPR